MGREHWVETTLGECCQINPRNKVNDESQEVTFVTMSDISQNSPVFKSTQVRSFSEVKKGFTHFAENDVLFAKITPCMENGKAALANNLQNGLGCGTTELHVIRPLCGVESALIYNFVHQPIFRTEAEQCFTGSAGQRRVPVDFLYEYPFSLPPLNEQKRIVEKLNAILPKVKNAKARLEKIPLILKKFRQSVLSAACSGRLTADWREEHVFNEQKKNNFDGFDIPNTPLSWDWVFITDLVSNEKNSLKAGPFGSSLKKECYAKEGYKIYGQEQVINGDAFFGNYYVDELKYRELETCKVKPNDVLISLVGTVGKVLILPENCFEGIINPRLVKITFDLSKYAPRFFEQYFSSMLLKSFYSELLHGSTMDVLNLRIIKSLPFPLPPLEEQQEIVRRVEKLFALADSLEAKYKKAIQRVEKIEQSVLAKAFRGELANPDPNDEPAAELLKRILEEKTMLKTSKKNGYSRNLMG